MITLAFQLMLPSPGVMVVVDQSVAAEYPPQLNPYTPVSEVVPPLKTPALPPMPPAPMVGAAMDSAVEIDASPTVSPSTVDVIPVPWQTDPPVELHDPPTPVLRPAIAATVLVSGVRRYEDVDIKRFHLFNALAYEGISRKAVKQHYINLTGTLFFCGGHVQAKGRRAPVPTASFPRVTQLLQPVFVDLAGLRKIVPHAGLCS